MYKGNVYICKLSSVPSIRLGGGGTLIVARVLRPCLVQTHALLPD